MTVATFSRTAGVLGAGWNRLPRFWQVQIAGWSVFAVVDLVNLQAIYHDLMRASARTLLVVVYLLAVSTGMRRIYATLGLRNIFSPRTLAWVGVLSATGGVLAAILILVVGQRFDWEIPGRDGFDEFLFPLTHYTIVLAGWSLCYFWIRADLAEQAEHKRALRAEAEALRARLEELRLQLDPHFLFNALNGVAEEIPDHPSAALAMLRDLTAYLRHSLDGIHRTVVPVEAEVDALAAYLRVQQARFGERLRVAMQVDPAAASRRIASFLLQPLVENAVKHGRRDGDVDLSIDIRADGDTLRIEIENSGRLDGGGSPRRHRPGIGLENVRRRLALHYPGRHRFSLAERSSGAGRVVASLVLEGEPWSGP